MASTLLKVLVVVACMVAVCSGMPNKKDLGMKKAAPTPPAKNKCNHDCSEYAPICASKDDGKLLSFGSQCVLDKYNCMKNENLKKVRDGECPNSSGILLS